MAAPATLHVRVISPDKLLYDGDASLVIAPGTIDTLGIFPGHTPFYAELQKGEIVIQGEKEELFQLKTGIIRLRDTTLTIILIPPDIE